MQGMKTDVNYIELGAKYDWIDFDNTFTLAVPAGVEILNPSDKPRAFPYLFWIVDPDDPAGAKSFQDSLDGRGMCHPFGWLTDYSSPYRFEHYETLLERPHSSGAARDSLDMIGALISAVEHHLPCGTWWTFAWMEREGLDGYAPISMAPFIFETEGKK